MLLKQARWQRTAIKPPFVAEDLWNAATGVRVTTEQSKILESRLQRLVELRWQREVIARWLEGIGNPAESQPQLEEMFAQVNAELQILEGTPSDDVDTKQAG